ncbi:MAG: DUF4169 domain-containing protein [Legionella sp. 40-6]|nr:DUF4169 family protein [Legionella sp.]OJY47462.1 MAG: DUF4169 domain-containing protein [Legionella sp. 40-6]
MAEIINLNKKRKAKKRIEKEKTAIENRIKFGRSKKEKQNAQKITDHEEQFLDGHKLEKKDEDEGEHSI